MDIANKIEKICEDRGISKSQLAKLAGIHRSTIYSMLEREKGANIISIMKICKATGMTIDDFIDETRDERLTRIINMVSKMEQEDKEQLITVIEGATHAVSEKRRKYNTQ